MRVKTAYCFIAIIALCCSCAPVLISTPEDAKAKEFAANPKKANVYLYRNDGFVPHAAGEIKIGLNGKTVGTTKSLEYLVFDLQPGKYEFAAFAENLSKLTLSVEAKKNYYIWQEMKWGMLYPRSELHEVSEEVGQKGVRECQLVNGRN